VVPGPTVCQRCPLRLAIFPLSRPIGRASSQIVGHPGNCSVARSSNLLYKQLDLNSTACRKQHLVDRQNRLAMASPGSPKWWIGGRTGTLSPWSVAKVFRDICAHRNNLKSQILREMQFGLDPMTWNSLPHEGEQLHKRILHITMATSTNLSIGRRC
jgi:hypothetical protein